MHQPTISSFVNKQLIGPDLVNIQFYPHTNGVGADNACSDDFPKQAFARLGGPGPPDDRHHIVKNLNLVSYFEDTLNAFDMHYRPIHLTGKTANLSMARLQGMTRLQVKKVEQGLPI